MLQINQLASRANQVQKQIAVFNQAGNLVLPLGAVSQIQQHDTGKPSAEQDSTAPDQWQRTAIEPSFVD